MGVGENDFESKRRVQSDGIAALVCRAANIQIWMLAPAVNGHLNRARAPKRNRLKPKRGQFGEHSRECCTKAGFVVEKTPGAVRRFDDAVEDSRGF
jgi:hypothetical protein